MSNNLWEKLITVIDTRPHKFFVRMAEVQPSSLDHFGQIPIVYIFEETNQSNQAQKLQFVVKVTRQLIQSQFSSNEHGLHNAAISFGLFSIRKEPDKIEFMLTTDEFDRLQKIRLNSGPALRKEVLRFIYTINELWPDESVSHIDLQDNMIGADKEGGDWLNRLTDEGLLERVRRFKEHSRARGKPDTVAFRIAPKARKEVIAELNPSTDDSMLPSNHFYMLVDLEVEKKGPFAFVIMPFKESEFPQRVYEDIIRPAVENTLECACVRNDEDLWPGQLDDKFYSHIRRCQFLIAELTTENPNVVYELGIAHALNKDVIILVDKTRRGERKLSFDFDKFGTIFYSSEEELESFLTRSLGSLAERLKIQIR
jgi:hypothetical protein